jgi:hypothetical protein
MDRAVARLQIFKRKHIGLRLSGPFDCVWVLYGDSPHSIAGSDSGLQPCSAMCFLSAFTAASCSARQDGTSLAMARAIHTALITACSSLRRSGHLGFVSDI